MQLAITGNSLMLKLRQNVFCGVLGVLPKLLLII